MKDLSDVMKETRILKALYGLALLVAFLSGSGCATTALSKKGTGGRIKVFELGQRIPRNSTIMDTLQMRGSRGLVMGTGDWGKRWGSCGYRGTIWALKREAKARGGDALAILHVRKPNSYGGCTTIRAFLLDMIDLDDWPRIGLTEEGIRRDFDAGERTLDDIEGIWESRAHSEVVMDDDARKKIRVSEYIRNRKTGKLDLVERVPPSFIQAMGQLQPEEQSSFRVAIVKTTDDPSYPYAAYILDPDIPEWQTGFLKARLRRTADGSGYEAKWYGSTFQDDLREFNLDESGALTTKAVVEQGLKYSVEQTLTRVYPPPAEKRGAAG